MMFFKASIAQYAWLVLIAGLVLFLNLKPPLDPDLGWHLRSGQDLVQQRTIPRFDAYSHTMPDWERESHEWLTNGLAYLVYDKWGLFALSAIFSLITTLAFFLISRLTEAKMEYSLLAVLLGSLGSLPITGVRIQMLSLLGLSLTLFILFRFRQNQSKKAVYFLPLLFFIWVNLHGGFSIGLFAMGLFLFFEGIKIIYLRLKAGYRLKNHLSMQKLSVWLKKLSPVTSFLKNKLIDNNELIKDSLTPRSWLKLAYISLFSLATTFINPYGYKVYSLVITVLRDDYGRARISEWQSFSIGSPIGWEFLMYAALLIILTLICFKKIDLTILGLGIIFASSALASWRNIPVFIIITIPLWVYIAKSATDPTLIQLLRKKLILLLLLATAIIGYQQIPLVWTASYNQSLLAEMGKYPKKAVDYIKAHPEKFQGNMFNEYNWGGYLIWQLPEHRVFIDGRMPHLQIGGRHIFKDFNDFQSLKNTKAVIEKYQIDWVLIYNNRLVGYYLPNEGFKKIYEDDLAAIFLKE